MTISKKILISPLLLTLVFMGLFIFFYNQISVVINSISQEVKSSSLATKQVYVDSIFQLMELTKDISFNSMLGPEPAELTNILSQLMQYEAIRSAYFVDVDERIIADGTPHDDLHPSKMIGKPIPDEAQMGIDYDRPLFTVRDNQLVYSHPFNDQGDPIGRLQVIISLDKLSRIQSDLQGKAKILTQKSRDKIRSILIGTTAIIILSFCIILFFVLRIITNLNLAVDVAKEVSAGNFDIFIENNSTDETGTLLTAMQTMVENVRQVNKTLEKSEVKYRNIFDRALEGIFQTTPAARFLSVNHSMVRILGYDSPDEVLSGSPDIAKQLYVDPARRDEIFHLLEANDIISDFEVQLYKKDQSIIWVSLNIRGVKDQDGNLLFTEGFATDITERKQAADALRQLNEELEQRIIERTAELAKAKDAAETANQSKSDFLARMSHEIRTPLNAVTGLTKIVLKSELSTEQRDYLNKVRIASNNLLEVINDILDFSKVEAGRLELIHAPFDMGQVLEQLADLFSNRVAQKDLELIFALTPQVPRQLTGDAGRLTQVLINLIENAVKFTDTGEIVVGVEPAVLVEQADQQPGKTMLLFSVGDTGTGIAADVLPSLFEPFTQADSYLTRKHEGTGLGLAICQRLVELMGGRIWAESTPGQGSTFLFTVLVEAQKKDIPSFNLPPDLHGLKTLVVDDSAAARQTLADILESFNFTVAVADSGAEALTMLHRAADEPYKLVLMDWQMPGMDGIQTATMIRNDSNLASPLIIIMVTAYGHKLVETRLDSTAVVDASLLKPVKASQLFDTIMDLFGRAKAAVPPITTKRTAPLSRLDGRRVLVVEDSELNREVAVTLLEEAGLIVETAENGQVAVDKVTGSPRGYYDAVLMDIQMPIMEGYEATRRIRAFELKDPNSKLKAGKTADKADEPVAPSAISPQSLARSGQVPIIALTAHALTGEKDKCLSTGMDDYLAKPIDEEQLHRVLLKWIIPQQEETNRTSGVS